MKRGAIIIHGLTGTPATMAPITEALSKSGLNVIAPLLPGHGTSLRDLDGTRYSEWVLAVENAYDRLTASGCDDICCAGLSLGGLLTLRLAMDKKRPLSKIACMGTPVKLSLLLENILLPLSKLPIIRSILRTSKKNWKASVMDPSGRQLYRSISYESVPVRSVWELQKLQEEVLKGLGAITSDVLIIHSKRDRVAHPFNVDILMKYLSVRPEVLWLDRSEHVMTLDVERDTVVGRLLVFFSS